jgi:hypothetical protein
MNFSRGRALLRRDVFFVVILESGRRCLPTLITIISALRDAKLSKVLVLLIYESFVNQPHEESMTG